MESNDSPAQPETTPATPAPDATSATPAPELDPAAAAAEAEPAAAEIEAASPAAPEAEAATAAAPDAEAPASAPAAGRPQTRTTNVRFHDFPLPAPLLRAIDDLGFQFCTPIQAQSLKITLNGHDVTGKAQTGTGKTAAFLSVIINDLLNNPPTEERYVGEPRALVIAPTRELVMQIAKDAKALTKYTDLKIVTLVGGIDYQKQQQQLDRDVCDIVVATPGRLLDFIGQRNISLGLVELLVIDEADRMMDMGFIPQVRQIVGNCPRKEYRQTLLFSATFTDDILALAERWAMNPIRVEIEPERVTTDNVKQIVYLVTTDQKYPLLYHLIQSEEGERVIVFTNRRDQARRLADNLHRNGISVGLLSGEVAQPKRVKTLEEFRNADIQVLVATDVAGRGLHIDDISHVVNFTLPEESDDYVHRIGRTGRAGALGTSISFACEDDAFLLPGIEAKIGMKLPCEYPSAEQLAEPPPFSRPSKFKAEEREGGGNRGGGGGGRNRSGGGGGGGGRDRRRRS